MLNFDDLVRAMSDPQAGPATRTWAAQEIQKRFPGQTYTPGNLGPGRSIIPSPDILNAPTVPSPDTDTPYRLTDERNRLMGGAAPVIPPAPPMPPAPPKVEPVPAVPNPNPPPVIPEATAPMRMMVTRDASGRVTGGGNTAAFAARPGAREYEPVPSTFMGPPKPAMMFDPVDNRMEQYTPVPGGGFVSTGSNPLNAAYLPDSVYERAGKEARRRQDEVIAADPFAREKAEAEAKGKAAIAEAEARARGNTQTAIATEQAKVQARLAEAEAVVRPWLDDQLAQIEKSGATPQAKENARRVAIQKAEAQKREYLKRNPNGEDFLYAPPPQG